MNRPGRADQSAEGVRTQRQRVSVFADPTTCRTDDDHKWKRWIVALVIESRALRRSTGLDSTRFVCRLLRSPDSCAILAHFPFAFTSKYSWASRRKKQHTCPHRYSGSPLTASLAKFELFAMFAMFVFAAKTMVSVRVVIEKLRKKTTGSAFVLRN